MNIPGYTPNNGLGLLIQSASNSLLLQRRPFNVPGVDGVRGGDSSSHYPWPSLDPSAGTLTVFSRFHATTRFGQANWNANVLAGVNTRSFVNSNINPGDAGFYKEPQNLVSF
jgi:hypothetical protein